MATIRLHWRPARSPDSTWIAGTENTFGCVYQNPDNRPSDMPRFWVRVWRKGGHWSPMELDMGAEDMARAFLLAETEMPGAEDMRIANGSAGEN